MFRSMLLLFVVCLWAIDAARRSHRVKPVTADKVKLVTPVKEVLIPRCHPEYLFFEFTSAEQPQFVKKRFSHVDVLYSFKVFGVGRYFFVVKNDQREALKGVLLPPDAMPTASVIPVESIATFLGRKGISGFEDHQLPDEFPDGDLTYVERTWEGQGLNEEQNKAVLAEQVWQITSLNLKFPRALFMAAAHLPTKFVFFWKLDDCNTARLLRQYSDALGGPGSLKVTIQKICNL